MKPHEVYYIMNNSTPIDCSEMTDTETLIVATCYTVAIIALIIFFIYLWLQDRI